MRSKKRFVNLRSSVVAAIAFAMLCLAEVPALFSSRLVGILLHATNAVRVSVDSQIKPISRPRGFGPNRRQNAPRVRFPAQKQTISIADEASVSPATLNLTAISK